MKANKLAQVALLLWVATVAVLLWFFLRGSTAADTDNRTAIMLHPAERALLLSEMRDLLVATQGVLAGANQRNLALIAKAARAGGMAGTAEANPALMAKLPLEFKALNMNVRHEMDQIAKAAEDGRHTGELLKMTSDTLTKCVACHAAWQFKTN